MSQWSIVLSYENHGVILLKTVNVILVVVRIFVIAALLQQSRPVTLKAAERQNTFVIGATFRRDESADELSLVKDSGVKMIVHFDSQKDDKVQHMGRTILQIKEP